MTDVLCVFGTRPEAIKVAPVVEALRAHGLAVRVIATGQHTTLLDQDIVGRAMGEMSTLGIASDGKLLRFLTRARNALRAVLSAATLPRVVLVQGDTMSALVGALVAGDLKLPTAHVEAGVRSGSRSDPWPEELIRMTIDRQATWRYAPTQTALRNLAKEGLDGIVVGNTSVDALRRYTSATARPEASPTVLVTLHRRELQRRADVHDVLQALCNAIAESHVRAVWPVHPTMHPLVAKLTVPANFLLRPPMAHATMCNALAEARGLVTDSGGLVEEAATLGVPTAIVRFANDRPEAVAAGIAIQAPPTAAGVRFAVQQIAHGAIPRRPQSVYGAGTAAEQIAAHLVSALATQ